MNTPATVAEASIPWRRRDANPEQKGIIVINASTGKVVDNVLVEINRSTDVSGSMPVQVQGIAMYTICPTIHREVHTPK